MPDNHQRVLPRLVADETVGRLTRFLRLLGYDTRQAQGNSRTALLRAARSEDRIVLTRRTSLTQQPGLRILIVNQPTLQGRLRAVQAACGKPDGMQPRCPKCNEPLRRIDRNQVKGKVPPYVWRSTAQFSRCERCGNIYWPGTHLDSIKDTLGVPLTHPES